MTEPVALLELAHLTITGLEGPGPYTLRLTSTGPLGDGTMADLTVVEAELLCASVGEWLKGRNHVPEAEQLLDRAVALSKEAHNLRAAFRKRSGPWHHVGDLLSVAVAKLLPVESFARVAYHHDDYKELAEDRSGLVESARLDSDIKSTIAARPDPPKEAP